MTAVRCVRGHSRCSARAEWARIVNFSAHSTRRQSPLLVAYTASKAAIASFSKNLSLSLAPEGILVNTVSPGSIVTASFSEGLRDVFAEEGLDPTDPYDVMRWIDEHFHQPAALGRAGLPEEVASSSPISLANQRVRDRCRRQRGRRLGLRLMLEHRRPDRGGHREDRPHRLRRPSWKEGFELLIASFNGEAASPPAVSRSWRCGSACCSPTASAITDFLRTHPEIADEEIEGPLLIIGLPRTGTTALSNLLAADPQIRSLRLWESSDPLPPPEAATRRPTRASTRPGEGSRRCTRPSPQYALAPLPVADRTDRVPRPARNGVPHRALRRHGQGSELRGLGPRLRHVERVRAAPAGPPAVAVALPAPSLAPEDAGAHAGARRAGDRLPEGEVPLDPPGSRRGARLGLQPASPTRGVG